MATAIDVPYFYMENREGGSNKFYLIIRLDLAFKGVSRGLVAYGPIGGKGNSWTEMRAGEMEKKRNDKRRTYTGKTADHMAVALRTEISKRCSALLTMAGFSDADLYKFNVIGSALRCELTKSAIGYSTDTGDVFEDEYKVEFEVSEKPVVVDTRTWAGDW